MIIKRYHAGQLDSYEIPAAEYDAVAVDAARYRWLREHHDLKVYAVYYGAGLDIAVDVDRKVFAERFGGLKNHA